MNRGTTDRNLLVGILALQMDFIDRDQLVSGMNAWVIDKSACLEDVLRDQGVIDDSTRDLVFALVNRHIQLHNEDVEQSLAAVGLVESSVRDELNTIADDHLEQSLQVMADDSVNENGDELASTVGAPSASGEGFRFRVLRPHAKGGLGKVSVALDQELNREVAIKEIQQRYADSDENRARFVAEAEVTGGLEHPGIVPVYGLGTYSSGRPFYAMRLIRGDSMKEATDRFFDQSASHDPDYQGVEFRKLMGRFIDVCNAIAYAHSRGVLHRDLKPGNIMLGKYGETLVVDWGLSKLIGREELEVKSDEPTLQIRSGSSSSVTQMGSTVGTPAFMSPEQAAGRLDALSPQSDVYSLGATMYCLLTGERSVDDTHVGKVLKRVQRGDFSKPSQRRASVPAPLEAVCLKAMALRPEDRYTSPNELAEDVESWLADEPVSVYRDPVSVRLGRWGRRNQSLVAGVAAAVAVALVGLAVGMALLTEKNSQLASANSSEQLAREKAQRRFELAMESVEKYYSGVSEDVILKQPELEQLRTKLLDSARDFYDKLRLELEDDPDPDAKAAMASAYLGIAQVNRDLGNEDNAFIAFQSAVELGRELAELDDCPPNHRKQLAVTYKHLGVLQRSMLQTEEARESLGESIKIAHQLVEDHPNVAEYQYILARSYNSLANNLKVTGSLQEALLMYQKAQAILDDLAKRQTDDPEIQLGLGMVQANLGQLYRDLGQYKESLASHNQAVEVHQSLVDRDGNSVVSRAELGRALNGLGFLYRHDQHWKEAGDFYQRAVEQFEQIDNQAPNVVDYQVLRATAYAGLASVQTNDGDLQAAGDNYRKSTDVADAMFINHFADVRSRAQLVQIYLDNCSFLIDQEELDEASKIAGRILPLQEALIDEFPNDLSARGGLADILNMIGLLQSRQSQHHDALSTFERLRQLRESLVDSMPTSIRDRLELTRACYNVGVQQLELSLHAEAYVSLQSAADQFESIVVDAPTSTDAKAMLARTYGNLALVSATNRSWQDALNYRTKANEILNSLVDEYPKSKTYHELLGFGYIALRDYQSRSGDRESATFTLQESIGLLSAYVEQTHDHEMISMLAEHWWKLGFYHFMLKNAVPGLIAYQESLKLLETLLTAYPEDDERAAKMANRYRTLGRRLFINGELRKALPAQIRSVELLESTTDTQTASAEQLEAIARGHDGVSSLRSQLNDIEGAIESCQSAIEAHQLRLVREQVEPLVDAGLSRAFAALGKLQNENGDHEHAVVSLRRAVEVCPTDGGIQLATALSDIATLQLGLGQNEDALQSMDRSVDILGQAIADGNLDSRIGLTRLSFQYFQRARLLLDIGRFDDAIEQLTTCIDLAPSDSSRRVPRLERSRAIALSGDYRNAIDEIVKISEDYELGGGDLVLIAGVYALASQSSSQDEKLSKDERDQLSNQFLNTAFDRLEEASQDNSFPRTFLIQRIENEELFHSIREVTRFQEILADIKRLANPAPKTSSPPTSR